MRTRMRTRLILPSPFRWQRRDASAMGGSASIYRRVGMVMMATAERATPRLKGRNLTFSRGTWGGMGEELLAVCVAA